MGLFLVILLLAWLCIGIYLLSTLGKEENPPWYYNIIFAPLIVVALLCGTTVAIQESFEYIKWSCHNRIHYCIYKVKNRPEPWSAKRCETVGELIAFLQKFPDETIIEDQWHKSTVYCIEMKSKNQPTPKITIKPFNPIW